MHSFSFFETPAKNVPLILEELNGRKLKGRELRVELAEQDDDNAPERGGRGDRKERRKDRERAYGSRDDRKRRDDAPRRNRDERSDRKRNKRR
mgnify:CR=1 FL=1